MEGFEVLTDEDRRSYAYALCVLGMVAAGGTLGSMAGGMTLPSAAGGLAFGLLMCRTVEKPLKQKLFDASARMTPEEFRLLAGQTARSQPGLTRKGVLDLLAQARSEAAAAPAQFRC